MPDNPDADKPAEKRPGRIIGASINIGPSASIQAHARVRRVQESPTANPTLAEAVCNFAQALNEKQGVEERTILYEDQSSGSNRHVFINCPFDDDYRQLFEALIFTIYDCGFRPRCALEDPSGQRFPKICRLMQDCPYAIHDLSRTEVDRGNQLPRFNMPLELGIFLGIDFVSGNDKKFLVLEADKYRYRQFCSDLSGFEASAHGGDTRKLICAVRNWLRGWLSANIPGGEYIFGRYNELLSELPGILKEEHLTQPLIYHDYKDIVEQWIKERRLDETQTS
jgi:hypothetical protein